jgi:alkanesulfonate monooxygenase SsuD/methylene tetrahydromethanopterin reductase-like flavin-dependent oxidoreductase (luciferase family)
VNARFAQPPGYVTEATQRAGIESQIAQAAARAEGKDTATIGIRNQRVARNMQEYVDAGYILIGSPDEVAEQLREVAKTLNVGNFMLMLQFGNMSKELTKLNTRLFAEGVAPKVRDLFAEWEHRWWPQPMPRSAKAVVPPFEAVA